MSRVTRADASSTRSWTSVRKQVGALDAALFEAVADTHSPMVDAVMPRLTKVADRSVLWIGIAALCGLSGSRHARRGAVRGLVTLGITSLIANQVSKRLHRRPRPSIAGVPLARLSRRIPSSTSFPSGHSASAAAFATAMGQEAPLLGVPLKALAGAVGFSRVATGAHYPSDVAAGLLLGTTVAAVIGRLVPPATAPDRLARPRAVQQVTPRPTGQGVTLVINPHSHSGKAGAMIRPLRRALPELSVIELQPNDDVAAVLRHTAAHTEVLAVAGGDGTVATAAQAAIDAGTPLAVFPAGTFNHFAKDLRVYPLKAAIAAVREGTVTKVDVGYVNDTLFLNTASVGAYTDFVSIRERYEHRIGKPLAALLAGVRTLRRRKSLLVRIDGVEKRVSLFFLGNGRYRPRGFAPLLRDDLDDGLIDLRMLDTSSRLARLSVLFAVLTGQLEHDRRYSERAVSEVTIELPDGPVRIARDGELGESSDRLHVRVASRRADRLPTPQRPGLTMYLPSHPLPDHEQAHRFVSTGTLPDLATVDTLVHEAYRRFANVEEGALSRVYPALATADPAAFGICLAGVSGAARSVGDVEARFTLMSVTKPFVFALACEALGIDAVRRLVGVNATGLPFNSAQAVERTSDGRTNPMVNAGAIATTSAIPGATLDERWAALHEGLSRFAGRPLGMDEATLASARATNFQNRALAMLLGGAGALIGDPLDAVDLYTRQCCLEVSAQDLAIMGATLADGGVHPISGERVVSQVVARASLAVMSIAGMYESSGDWLLDVGMPGKSGISGGVVAISPGKGALGVFSPPLDNEGNSVRGQLVARFLARELGLDVLGSASAH